MKKILLILIPLLTSFLFTGCINLQINYDDKYVESNSVKYISNKNQDLSVQISHLDYSISKKPNGFAGSAIDMHLNSDLNEQILNSVLSQYFYDIKISNEKTSDLIISSKLLDFNWESLLRGQKTGFKVDISVMYHNKEILHKIYNESFERSDLVFGFTFDTYQLNQYITNQHLFELYQRKFIPDLAEALKANQ